MHNFTKWFGNTAWTDVCIVQLVKIDAFGALCLCVGKYGCGEKYNSSEWEPWSIYSGVLHMLAYTNGCGQRFPTTKTSQSFVRTPSTRRWFFSGFFCVLLLSLSLANFFGLRFVFDMIRSCWHKEASHSQSFINVCFSALIPDRLCLLLLFFGEPIVLQSCRKGLFLPLS